MDKYNILVVVLILEGICILPVQVFFDPAVKLGAEVGHRAPWVLCKFITMCTRTQTWVVRNTPISVQIM